MNSVDNILRTMSRTRKHTTSTSSTTSSLSEAWSLTRINSYEQNQTQKMVCFFSYLESKFFFFSLYLDATFTIK